MKDDNRVVWLPDPIQDKKDERFFKKLVRTYWEQPPMTREQIIFEFFDDENNYPPIEEEMNI